MKIVIVDYHMGNLGSVRRAFEECGAQPVVSEIPRDMDDADAIILPGVGSFSEGMKNLVEGGWVKALRRAVKEDKKPLLGICLGMQMLADRGFEGGETPGLCLIGGEVRRFETDVSNARIPHVGWNEVQPIRPSPLFKKIPAGSDFYFVHSYIFVPDVSSDASAQTPYCGMFTSAVSHENIHGVQFHPEKSSRSGFQLLRNFIELARFAPKEAAC